MKIPRTFTRWVIIKNDIIELEIMFQSHYFSLCFGVGSNHFNKKVPQNIIISLDFLVFVFELEFKFMKLFKKLRRKKQCSLD